MKTRLKVTSVKHYESAIDLMCFLDNLALKEAWRARGKVMRRESEYWNRCDHCDEPMGEHDDPCYVRDRFDEDYYRDR